MRLVSLAEDRCADENQSHIDPDRRMWLLVRIILERRSHYNIRSKSHSTMAQKKTPRAWLKPTGFVVKSGDTYSRILDYHRLRKLNYRVRNGNGCDLSNMFTGKEPVPPVGGHGP